MEWLVAAVCVAYALLERWRRVAAEGDAARARRLLRRLSGREWQDAAAPDATRQSGW